MEEKMQVIEVSSGSEVVEAIKVYVASILSGYYEELLSYESPKEEDFITKEAFDAETKKQMIELVEEIAEVKEMIFKGVLDSYNNFLSNILEVRNITKIENQESIETIISAKEDMKRTGVVCIGLTLLFPSFTPIILLVNIPRIGIDFIASRAHSYRMKRNEWLEKEIKDTQTPFYEFTDTLRTDYHETKRELNGLKQKASQGENIVPQLLPILDPVRVSLSKIDQPFLMEKQEERNLPQEEDSFKQYKK